MHDYAPLEWQIGLGYQVDENRCRAAVPNSVGVGSHQCRRKPRSGERYCATHMPSAIEKRRMDSDRRYQEKMAGERKRYASWYGAPFIEALRQIAAGHNDPRSLASEVLEREGFTAAETAKSP